MDFTVEANTLKDALPTLTSVVILLPDNASRDAVAAALALYLSFIQLGKSTTVAYPRPAIVGWSHLVGVNKLVQNLGNKNFVISLEYVEGSIEKVSYNIEGNKFNLVVEPRVGAPAFDEKKVNYSYSGISADLIIGIGVSTPEGLGKYYLDNKPLFAQKTVLAIDHKGSVSYGKINVSRPAATVSELSAQFMKDVGLPMTPDIASNLYDGIVSGSRNFTITTVSADTFEVVAHLLRQGARKMNTRQEEMPDKEFAQARPPEAPQTPPDWLKPKIYSSKGPSLL